MYTHQPHPVATEPHRPVRKVRNRAQAVRVTIIPWDLLPSLIQVVGSIALLAYAFRLLGSILR